MLDIRVRMVLNRLVVSFWCNSHGGEPHCLWSAACVTDEGGPDVFAANVADCTMEFARKLERGQLHELSDECLG